MTSALARLPYATLACAAIATTIFSTALGSSSVAELGRIGRPLRWLALVILVTVAALWARSRRERLWVPAAVVVTSAWFVLLCFFSAAWSVKPLLTLERAVTLTALLAAAWLVADAAAGRPRVGASVIDGVLWGAAAVAIGGLGVLAFDRSAAVRHATVGVPARYQGLGESPNTAALLLALAAPAAVWLALARRRWVGGALVLLFVGSIAASGSRGALVAALAGSVVVVLLHAHRIRKAAALLAVAAAVFVSAVAVGTIPRPGTAAAGAPAGGTPAHVRFVDVEKAFPLEDDVGRPLPGRGEALGGRTILGSSGRVAVWGHAISQALQRPVDGYGFGTEHGVFVDRYAGFEGGYVESSFVGLTLQLGIVGLASLLALVSAAVVAGRRGFRVRGVGPAAAGAAAAGLVAAFVQSYVYSAGNVAALTFWLALALASVAAVPVRELP